MVEILRREEAIPASYPPVPSGLSAAAGALDSDAIWARIENYIAHRWTSREVVWTVQGPGDWVPDLTPHTVTATEIWESYAWAAVTLSASPLGGRELPSEGPYRITASVGGGVVPAAVSEAFRRLAEYLAEDAGQRGASSWTLDLGEISETIERSPAWLAKAIQNSGAADLLRPFRRI